MNDFSGAAHTTAPPWAMWVLDRAQVGMLVLDQEGCLIYANQWITAHTRLAEAESIGRPLSQVFPVLVGSYLEKALQSALKTGFASVLSNSLHGSPFPLHKAQCRSCQPSMIQQSIQIMPMEVQVAANTWQRYLLVQINDVTQAVNRERLLKAHATALHSMASIDALTGISNRRHFDETLAKECRHAMRELSPLSVIMVDLDNFKGYNDTYGHVKGDETLTLVADTMRRTCNRPRDLAARYGGEEMVLVLPDTNAEGAHVVALDLQAKILDLSIEHAQNLPSQKVSLSIGIATLTSPAQGFTAKALVGQADQALYHAKQSGRNQICVYDSTVSIPA